MLVTSFERGARGTYLMAVQLCQAMLQRLGAHVPCLDLHFAIRALFPPLLIRTESTATRSL